MFIENKYVKFKGLNLTVETLDGLLKHNGPYYDDTDVKNLIGLKNLKNKIDLKSYPSIEAQIASISDDIAYNNHDIQDGFNANIFRINELKEINFFNEILKRYSSKFKKINSRILIYQMVRDSINLMVKDLIKTTIKNIKKYRIKKYNDIYNSMNIIASFSNEFKIIEQEIKYFLRIKMYDNNNVIAKNNEGKKIIKSLFKTINKKPTKFIDKRKINKKEKFRAIADFISGMTDRYAINLYNNFK